jgi:hypothetical protein
MVSPEPGVPGTCPRNPELCMVSPEPVSPRNPELCMVSPEPVSPEPVSPEPGHASRCSVLPAPASFVEPVRDHTTPGCFGVQFAAATCLRAARCSNLSWTRFLVGAGLLTKPSARPAVPDAREHADSLLACGKAGDLGFEPRGTDCQSENYEGFVPKPQIQPLSYISVI